MRHPFLTLGLFAALALTGCDQEGIEQVTLRVDHFREACPDGEAGYCLRVDDGSGAIIHAQEIAGFEHEWGFEYEIVAIASDDLELENGVLRNYDLVEVLTKTESHDDARFEIALSPAFVERVDETEFDLVSGTTARCETADVCDAVVNALYEGRSFTLELSHAQARRGSFVAHSVATRVN